MRGESDILGIGIESSCDETSVAIVRNGAEVLANEIFSQIAIHQEYFGVVPEIASRAHLETINALIDRALSEAGVGFGDLSYVAVTNRPGLVGSLLIGLQSAKAISFSLGIPLVAINHLEAHLYAPFLEGNSVEYPLIGLLVSGGNTALYRLEGAGEMRVIGRTVDDAVGEAFDKVSKHLNLGYPGGPLIEKLARQARIRRQLFPKILPEPGNDFRFSYSGIKTAVITYLREHPEVDRAELAYGFQERALELLVRRLFEAARAEGVQSMVVAGGVAANGRLRELLREGMREGERILIPSPLLCTDNAAMVAGLGYQYFMRGEFSDLGVDVHARA